MAASLFVRDSARFVELLLRWPSSHRRRPKPEIFTLGSSSLFAQPQRHIIRSTCCLRSLIRPSVGSMQRTRKHCRYNQRVQLRFVRSGYHMTVGHFPKSVVTWDPISGHSRDFTSSVFGSRNIVSESSSRSHPSSIQPLQLTRMAFLTDLIDWS